MEELVKILGDIQGIKKDTLMNYKYGYLSIINGSLVPNEELIKKYGNDRKGYEEYKKLRFSFYIEDSNKISLRPVIDRETNEVVAYVTEERLPDTKYNETIEKLRSEAYDVIFTKLGVKDKDNFDFYLTLNNNDYDFGTTKSMEAANYVRRLYNILEEYKNDEDFKKYLDKIIK